MGDKMEDIKFDINQEYKDVVSKISEKYGYNSDLRNTLEKILPAMLHGATYEDRQLYYRMLERTPIVLVPADSKVTSEELQQQYIGNVNPHIIEEKVDEGEYGRLAPAGAFVTEAVLDENLNLVGRKQFLFVKVVDTTKIMSPQNENMVNIFGTGINVPHLIHELGHAWAAEKEAYRMEGKDVVLTVGTSESKYEITPTEDGKFIKKRISRDGLFVEEGANTELEINSVANYLGVTREGAEEIYNQNPIMKSSYYSWIRMMTEHLTHVVSPKEMNLWRFHRDKNALERINRKLAQSQRYQEREIQTEEDRTVFEIMQNPKTDVQRDIFKRCAGIFNADRSGMTPIQLFENDLEKMFSISSNNYKFGLDVYKQLTLNIAKPAYQMLNQADEINRNNPNKQEQK